MYRYLDTLLKSIDKANTQYHSSYFHLGKKHVVEVDAVIQESIMSQPISATHERSFDVGINIHVGSNYSHHIVRNPGFWVCGRK